MTDQGQAISKRLVDLDKERATVTQKVASANAAVVSSLQRQVDEGKKLVRDNALRILQTRDGSKAQLQAIERYERSVASLQSRVQKLASTPLVSNESADVQRRLADIDSERAVLIEKQVQNTAKLEAAQKRMSALRRGGANILGAFGGVSGLAVTLGIMGVVAAVGSYAASLQRSAEATQNMKDELNALGLLSDEAAGKIDKTTKSLKELSADELRDKLRGVNEEIQKLSSQDSTVKNVWDSLFGEGELSIGEIQRQLESVINNPSRAVGGVNRNAASQIKELIDQAKAGSVTLEEAQSRLDKIAAVKLSPEMDKLIGATRSALPYFDALIERQKQLNEEISAPTKRPEERYWNTRTLAAQNQQKIQAAQDSVVTTLVDEANLNESEKRIKAIMDQIVKDMEKAGQTINSAAVRADAERVYATEQRTSDIGNATELIKGFESFRSTPYWDVNAYRVGYGSDTVTLSDGSIQKVTQGISVTMADANRDLERRIGEFQDTIRSQIGAGTFESMDKSQQAALTSIAYNYGDLPDRIVEAIRSGDQRTVYNAIKGLGSDNGGVNRGRRNQEAELYLSGTSKITQSTVGFDKTLESQQRMLDALLAETGIRQQLNPLVNDYGKALSTLEAAQQLLNAAQEQGTAAGNELKNVQQLLKGDFSSLTPEARAQAEAMLALAQKTGEATASGNRMEESQERLRNRLQQSSELGKSVFGGIIDDIRSGASAGEILNNVFDKLLDKMIEMSLTSIFDGTSGVAGGGPLGGLFSGLFSLFGFDDGGYTGPGGKKKPAGVVHAGEFVFDAEATRKAGVENLYRMMDMLKGNSLLSMPGYDMGGFVGRVSMPSFDVGGYANDNSTLSTMAGGLQRVQPMKVIIESNDEKFRVFVRDEATGVVEEASPQIIKTSVQASSQNVMPTVAKYNSEKAGAEWR
ncbi:glycoside hydrolase family protein [Rhizobium azibense]|uniref:glycoside hydrolase family protein n=1 Tax=Rhizobium azibense TaxID=1136135 RepID=UPI001FE0068A|nr:hypothetical protein [Rhizobium azibense]